MAIRSQRRFTVALVASTLTVCACTKEEAKSGSAAKEKASSGSGSGSASGSGTGSEGASSGTGSAGKDVASTNAGDLVVAQSFADLKISTALAVDVPKSVAGQGEAVSAADVGTIDVAAALTGGQKSREACEIRQRVRDTMDYVQQVAYVFCRLEAESDKVKFGTKYTITASDDSETSGVGFYVDKSKKNELSIYFCRGGRISDKFSIDGAKDGKSRGSFHSYFEDGEGSTIDFEGKFDAGFTTEGRTRISTKALLTEGDNVRREFITMNLKPSGTSILSAAIDRFDADAQVVVQTSAVAKIGQKLGSALVFAKAGDETISYRGFFDAAGNKRDGDKAKVFADNGRLFIPPALLPKAPPSDYAPKSFVGTEYDCSSGEPYTPNVDATTTAACRELLTARDIPQEACDDGSFEYAASAGLKEDDLATDDADVYGYAE